MRCSLFVARFLLFVGSRVLIVVCCVLICVLLVVCWSLCVVRVLLGGC